MVVTRTAKDDVVKRYGTKPQVNEFDENPIYALFDLYGFDIHQHSPVDLVQRAWIIGLLPKTITLINGKLLSREWNDWLLEILWIEMNTSIWMFFVYVYCTIEG